MNWRICVHQNIKMIALKAALLCCTLYYILHSYCLRSRFSTPYQYIPSIGASNDNDLAEYDCFRCERKISSECRRFTNSRKYQAGCMPVPSVLYPVLVTGLGGCGSHYIAHQLDYLGLQLPHEELGKDGSVSWFYAVNDVLANGHYPFRARLKVGRGRTYGSPRFQNVLHVVRCPMQHISSFTAHLNASYDFVRTHMLRQIDTAVCSTPPPFYSTNSQSSSRSATSYSKIDVVVCDDNEDSIWQFRNYKNFFLKRRGLILESGKNCARGGRCWLHFAALSWLFWTAHIQRYSDSFYRVETDLHRLIADTTSLVNSSRYDSPDKKLQSGLLSMRSHLQGLSSFQYFTRRKKLRVRHPSLKHRIHGNYTLSDIFDMDPELVREIISVATYFGYDMSARYLPHQGLPNGSFGVGVGIETELQSWLSNPSPFRHQDNDKINFKVPDQSARKLFKCH